MQNSRAFFRNQQGSIMPAMAAIMFILVGITGMAIDMARLHMVQARLSSSLDAAGLAAGSSPTGSDLNTVVNNYMTANFPVNYMGSTLSTVAATPDPQNNMIINLEADANVPTTFLEVLGIHSMDAHASAQITKQNTGMELALVLDNTGSMACDVNGSNCNSGSTSKIVALKTAVTGTGGLLDILYGSNTTIPNFWVGVVPFTDMVNIVNTSYGTTYTNWMDNTYDSGLDFGPVITGSTCPTRSGATVAHTGSGSTSRCTYTISSSATPNTPNFGPNGLWQGCLLARSSSTPTPLTYDINDTAPTSGTSATLFQYFMYPSTDSSASTSDTCTNGSNPWTCKRTTGSGSSQKTLTTYYAQSSTLGPNVGCIQTPILPMTATKGNVVTNVNSMTAGGSTMIDIGMAWGWRMLSPYWRGLWGGEMNTNSLPLAYNTPMMNKVVVLMTDGMNQGGSPSAYQTQSLPSDSTLDTKTLDVCTAMKNNGIIIYTIGFGTASTVNTTLLSNCATDTAHYYLAPTNAQLQAAFQAIGQSLANLRLSE